MTGVLSEIRTQTGTAGPPCDGKIAIGKGKIGKGASGGTTL